MRLSPSRLLPAVLAAALLAPSRADAGLLVVTSGPTVKHLGEIADAHKREGLRDKGFTHAAIGFRYHQFGLFWLEFWTWDGGYCVYEGRLTVRITREQAAELMGRA